MDSAYLRNESKRDSQMKPYYLFKPWVRWLPLPILVWIAKRKFESVIWYQDKDVVIQMERRHPKA